MKQYARIVGWVFLILGILSAFTDQIFGIIQFDMLQNIFRLAIGIAAIVISRPNTDSNYANLFCFLSGPSFFLTGILSFVYPTWGNMHFEAAENLLHFIFGIYALYLIFIYLKVKRNSDHDESSSSSSSSSHNS